MARRATIGASSIGVDYYAVLEIRPDATPAQIRTSFRRLVIAAHPDKNPARRDWSERRVRELIEAYETLGDPKRREEFDRKLQSVLRARRRSSPGTGDKSEPFFFRRTDPEARALLVLHLLLNGRSGSAVQILDDLEAKLGEGFLANHLDRADYLDCLFLLGEFHIGRKEYTKAAERLRAFYLHESSARFPRHYLPQVVDLLKDLYLRKLPRKAAPGVALAGLELASKLGLTRAEKALRLRRLVEISLVLDRGEEALAALEAADAACLPERELSQLRSTVRAARVKHREAANY